MWPIYDYLKIWNLRVQKQESKFQENLLKFSKVLSDAYY